MKLNILILGLVLSGLPIHISYGQGARYTGSYKKSDPVKYVNESNIVIEGLEFSDVNGDIIGLYNCENVVIKNNRFLSSNKRGVYLFNCKNVTIIDNTFENTHTALTACQSQKVKFEYNDVHNVGGLLALSDDTNNGFAVLFDKVSGEGNSISYNAIENIFEQSSPGDIINVNQSHGTEQSPIIVKGNWLRGGGPSSTGGGILLGDVGGSYQIAEDNILVNPGQYGVAIAGGHNMILRNNKVYAKKLYFNNVAIYAINYYESKFGKSHTIRVENNIVNYTSSKGISGNSWWVSDNMKPVMGIETNQYDPDLSASILPDKILGRARTSSDDISEEEPTIIPDGNNTNDPSICIYLDKYNRVCVNHRGSLESSAVAIFSDVSGKTLHEEPLTRFHTVLLYKPTPGKYTVRVENGDKSYLKTLNIP